MNLSDKTIKKEIENGNIIIEPFIEKHLNPNSIDLTLNGKYSMPDWNNMPPTPHGSYLDCKDKDHNKWIEKDMPEDGMILQPNQLYIYHCNERIGVKKNIRATVMGKSSLGRLGLFIHVTAGFVDTGFEGSLVLEMVATVPVKIYPNQKICQLEFVRVEGEVEESYDQKEGSKYMNQTGSQTSLMHKNFEQNEEVKH